MNTGANLHVAIIMDGNGRWAQARGLPRSFGHKQGAQAIRHIVESAPGLGIDTLTLYAFSHDNWNRPAPEVSVLMGLLAEYLRFETPRCVREGIRVSAIGSRARLPERLKRSIAETESCTANGDTMHLRLAIDYSSRDAILDAAMRLRGKTREELSAALSGVDGERVPDVDLLIRTGGEKRLSDFMLWECAYAELYFTSTFWPDFDEHALAAAMAEFHARERRFGHVSPAAMAGTCATTKGADLWLH